MIEDLLAELHSQGFRVNNMFELDSGMWQANLRGSAVDDRTATGWGQGLTAEGALRAAMESPERVKLIQRPVHVRVAEGLGAARSTTKAEDLL